MQVKLAYGQSHLPDDITTVTEPLHTPGLPHEQQAVLRAPGTPIEPVLS